MTASLPPHPGPLPLGGGEGGPQVRPELPKALPLPRRGGEGGGEEAGSDRDAATDLLILSDGTIFVHNLTPAMAAILSEINPHDPSIQPRALAMPR